MKINHQGGQFTLGYDPDLCPFWTALLPIVNSSLCISHLPLSNKLLQTQWLETAYIYNPTVSVAQECQLIWSSAQGLPRLKSGNQLELWSSLRMGVLPFSSLLLVSIFISLWLQDWSPISLLAITRNHSQVLEATWGFCLMAVSTTRQLSFRASRRTSLISNLWLLLCTHLIRSGPPRSIFFFY